MNKFLVCDNCYDLLRNPAVVATCQYGPCCICGTDSEEIMAKLYRPLSDVLIPLLETLALYMDGYKGGCYACEQVGLLNIELSNALTEVMLTAIKNGEDCSYLIARDALR